MTHARTGQQYLPGDAPSFAAGTRTYYVYDGSDVALAITRNGTSWAVRQRFVTGGVDEPLAGRFSATSSALVQPLAFIADRQGTTLAAMRADGTQETQTAYFSRNPFGSFENVTGSGGATNPETGFTGASTPNATGGFVYLRNRWYDPQTGRFLTQDPIGLAGGVNLYSYAGNSPVSFSDPFGLCPEWVDGKPCDLNAVANFAAGFGDAITFGATDWIRDKIDANGVVDKESAAYFGGEVTGVITSAALGGAAAKAIREGSTLATSGPVRSLATKLLSSETGRALFGKGGTLNSGRTLRMGVSRAKDGGRLVFRLAGEAVESAAGAKHINLIDLGRIEDFLRAIPK